MTRTYQSIGAHHLSFTASLSRNRLLTSCSRRSIKSNFKPAQECSVPNFRAALRAANIQPRMSAVSPGGYPNHACNISPPPRKSDRRAPAGDDHQRRRPQGWRRAMVDLRRDQFRRAPCGQDRKSDDHFGVRHKGLAGSASQLHRGRLEMSARVPKIDGPPPEETSPRRGGRRLG